MSDAPIPPLDGGPADPPAEESLVMPSWVPLVIGCVLVAMAALAVYTGLNYRRNTFTRIIKPRHIDMNSGDGPPGEPQAGASRVYPGDSGENVPLAGPPVAGKARIAITGGAAGLSTTERLWARRGLLVHVIPADAVVYVNDVLIGEASQFKSSDEIYDFPAPGSYTIRLVAPGYHDQTFVVTAADSAKQELATITTTLEKEAGQKAEGRRQK
jgi:hypothetical protein